MWYFYFQTVSGFAFYHGLLLSEKKSFPEFLRVNLCMFLLYSGGRKGFSFGFNTSRLASGIPCLCGADRSYNVQFV